MRVAADSSQSVRASPIVSHQSCFWLSTWLTVSSTSLKAASEAFFWSSGATSSATPPGGPGSRAAQAGRGGTGRAPARSERRSRRRTGEHGCLEGPTTSAVSARTSVSSPGSRIPAVTHVTPPRKKPLFSALSWARTTERAEPVCSLDRQSSSRTGGRQPHGSNQHQPRDHHGQPHARPGAARTRPAAPPSAACAWP